MTEAGEKAVDAGGRRLSDVVREVRNAAADREDVVVELREAQRTRLELLAAELEPIFSDVPADAEIFDFVISSGLQPRLWIDAVSHVTMGRDRRTYRFLRDTRLGRVVLAESTEIKPVAEQVTRYIAERLVERQRLIEGDVDALAPSRAAAGGSEKEPALDKPAPRGWSSFLSGLSLVLAGAAVGFAVAAAILWDRLMQAGLGGG